ncbi:hypothetical protein [Paracerasibacillus soli]|uniref:Uncharacterized protein n=1 Tax=Paracerasibacillus soli TaxID=480284 RepID=A0ABU5CNL7_9BACI|nr:hypothetical protein [Virgibacillus soli]MDY0407442.1 hypothetical protein [Virgibacillus soli]
MSKLIADAQSHGHSHDDDHSHDHDHSHGGKIEVILFFTGLVAFFIALFVSEGTLKTSLYLASLVLSGYHIMIEGFLDTVKQTMNRKEIYAEYSYTNDISSCWCCNYW